MNYRCEQCGGLSPLPAYAKGKGFRMLVTCPHCGRGGMTQPGEQRPAPQLDTPARTVPLNAHPMRTEPPPNLFSELFPQFHS